jgi:hypothetical protein
MAPGIIYGTQCYTLSGGDEKSVTPVACRCWAVSLREGASQTVFARYLNVTTGLVSQWERGEKRPQGASLKRFLWSRRTGSRL